MTSINLFSNSRMASRTFVASQQRFPDTFMFGAASAAFQVEGAWNVDGKGPSIWDTFSHEYPDKIADHSNADVSIDSYHLYLDDIAAAEALNVTIHRQFSHVY